MSKLRGAFVFILVSLAMPAMACSEALFGLMAERATPSLAETLEVSEIQSVEGGEWMIWRGAEGHAQTITRIDYGEMGRLESSLIIAGPDAYGVRITRSIYSAPIYIAGSSTIREESDIYMFCAGVLLVPDEDMGPGPDYAESARQALATFDAPEIAGYLPVLTR